MKNGDTKSCTGYWFLSSSVGVSFGSAKSMWRPSNWALKRFGLHQLPDKMTAKGEPVDAVEDQKQEWHHHQEEPSNKIINSSVCTVKPNHNKFPLLTWKVTRTVFRCDLSQTFLLIVMQECRNVLWLIVENDALVMAARDWSLKFMTNHKTSKVNQKKKCLEIPGPHNTQWLIAKNSQVNKQWGIN